MADLLFAMDSVPVVLSLSGSPFVLLASQCASLLGLRPFYFMLAAIASVLDSMQQALALILILIALKIFAEAAGYEVPLLGFAGVLLAWRVVAICWALRHQIAGCGMVAHHDRRAAHEALRAPTQLTKLLAEEPMDVIGAEK